MGMRKKGAERASMETLEPQDVASFGEDPELLDPAEEAALAGGNAGEPGPRQIQEPARSAQVQEPAAGRTEPESVEEEGASREQSGGETWSDEQVRKMAPNDSVPAWSLVKERQENRALKRNLEELTRKLTEHEEKWNRANERLRQLQERAGEKAENTRPAPDPEPDPRTDPEAHYQWELRQHRRALEALQQQQQINTAQVQAAQHQAMLSGLEQQFILAGHPDYYDRVKFVRERRSRELELMGYSDAGERARIIANEAAMLVSGAVRQGRNPALVVHELSEQWGFKPAQTANPPAGGDTASAADQIRDLQRKKAAASSLQAIASRPADGPVTLEDIADMDDEAYERYVDRNGGDLAALFRSGR